MAKFVTFDDGHGQYNFRAIFPSNTPHKEIYGAVKRKLKNYLGRRGLESTDFDWDNLKEFTTITGMKEGKFYEPDPMHGGTWND